MAPNHRKTAREAKQAATPKPVATGGSLTPGFQSNLFWGTASAAFAIVLTVVAATVKDLRPLLIIAVPLVCVASWEFARAANARKPAQFGFFGMGISAILLGGLYNELRPSAALIPQISSETKTQPAPAAKVTTRPPTFREIFNRDFPLNYGGMVDLPFVDSRTELRHSIPARMLLDDAAHTKFLAVYLDGSRATADECRVVLNNIEAIIRYFDQVRISTRTPGDTAIRSSSQFMFSNTVYIYMEADLTLQQEADIEKEYDARGLTVDFRGLAYFALHADDPRFQQSQSSQASPPRP